MEMKGGEKMAKNQIGTIILISLIVALIVSVVVALVFNNGTVQLGPTLSKQSSTIKAVLDTLNRCVEVEPSKEQNRWCSATCTVQGMKTIGSFTDVIYIALKEDEQRDLHMFSKFNWGDSQPAPSCGDETAIGCGLAGNAEELMELENGFGATTVTIEKVRVDSKCICCGIEK